MLGSHPFTVAPQSGRNRLTALALVAGGMLERVHYRAFAAWAKLAARLASSGATCEVLLTPDAKFEILLGDFYWNRLLSKWYRYEPEIERALLEFRDVDYALLDCGANFGYWSVLASSEAFGSHLVIAVEALPGTFERLRRNLELNRRDAVAVSAAIAEYADQSTTVYERGSHAGASLSAQWLGNARPISQTAQVRTVTIDDLVTRHGLTGRPLIVKLDVEGMEIPALRGAGQTLAGGALVIYEDSGEDRESRVSCYVMEELGLAVHVMSEAGAVLRVTDPQRIAALKPSRKRGYNFLAAAPGSVFDRWLTRLARA